jgi:hypothetical protein
MNDDKEKEKLFIQLVKELKKSNKINKKNESRIIKLEKEIKYTKITNSNNNNTINSNNNIQIVAFGKEDVDHISNGEWLKLLKNNYKSIEKLTEIVHFNKNNPENHNIYINNLRSKYIMTHDGNDWVVKDRKTIVDALYDDKSYIIFNKVDELNDTLPLRIVSKFEEIKDKYDEKK